MLMTIKDQRETIWNHCAHGIVSLANKRHETELHKNGSLRLFDCDSFDTCESCLLSKDDLVTLYQKG